MRISVVLLIFFLVLNGWGALLQQYDIDDHIGINAETGDPAELENATAAAGTIETGQTVDQTLLGYYNNLMNTIEDMLLGLQPGVQMLVNIAPRGVVEDIIVWVFGAILPIVMAADILAYARGVDF